jgi:hypothetical protein
MTLHPDKIVSFLISTRESYGADSPIGHRCSNVIQLLGNRSGAFGVQLSEIDKELVKQVAELERLSSEPAVDAEERDHAAR